MAITRRRFNVLARRLGLTPVNPSSRVPRYFLPLLRTDMPQVGVAGWVRAVFANDAFLAAFDEPAAVYTLGHEAGHTVYDHGRYRARETAHEIQADMWGIIALDAAGFSVHVAAETLSAMRAMFPEIDRKGEITARLDALAFATKDGTDLLHRVAFMSDMAPALHPVHSIPHR